MQLYLAEFLEGVENAQQLHKKGEDLFGMGNHAMFPTVSSQSKWRFARAGNVLRLHDGNSIYSFEAPNGESDETDFPLNRVDDVGHHEFETGATSKGLAQVHRADPGSIYFTIQEGGKNPTYTFRHEGGTTWKGIPKKKKKAKETIIPDVDLPTLKSAALHEFSQALGRGVQAIPDKLIGAAFAPAFNPLLAAGVGAAGGGLYDFMRRKYYNSPAENEDEDFETRATRYVLPAGVLGLLGMAGKSIAGKENLENWRNHGIPSIIG